MPIVVVVLGPSVVPIYEIQVKPCLVMAALIGWSQAECFSWDGECTMLMHFPKSMRTRWFEKTADVCPIVRNGSRSPQWRRASGVSKAQSVKASSIVLRLFLLRHRHAVPLKSPATKSTS